jgi:hypothetical protein
MTVWEGFALWFSAVSGAEGRVCVGVRLPQSLRLLRDDGLGGCALWFSAVGGAEGLVRV